MENQGGTSAYEARIAALRGREYPMLQDSIYLDHAGTTLYAKSLVDRFAADMTTNLMGNPHSASSSSQTSMSRIDDVRLRALQFFQADPSEFDLVFVANATAAIKLVAEAFRGMPGGFDYLYHEASHTSLVGVREEALESRCLTTDDLEGWLNGEKPPSMSPSTPKLFAYPAQSNMTGQRFSLGWSEDLRRRASQSNEKNEGNAGVFTLLDAAALVATSPLNLSDSARAPDFTVLSFYKIFGFPDLGALIVRRPAASVFRHRRYFGGGTVDMVVSVKEQWHAPKSQALHESLEDGTLPVHSIIALDSAFKVHEELFGSMQNIAEHTNLLASHLHHGLSSLRHGNDERVCAIYSQSPSNRSPGNGSVVAFNLRGHDGAWVSLSEFEKLAVLKKFHIRTGGLCNPGGITKALDLEPWEMKRNFSSGFRCGNENDIIAGKPTGIIRVSLGAMSTVSDVEKFVSFIAEFYMVKSLPKAVSTPKSLPSDQSSPLRVEAIMVYPIKSCGGYRVPKGVSWDVRPEGLAWDREWCLVHRGTGQALSQKRHPRMALMRPSIDFLRGCLTVVYCGARPAGVPDEIQIPLSNYPGLYKARPSFEPMASRVCGEEISAHTYASPEINDFFSSTLGVPCVLARFPAGGAGKSMRHSKAHLQKHQLGQVNAAVEHPGTLTPPDSDSENEKRRILLSNESPILAINLSSLECLNRDIEMRGGKCVSAEVFRANIVISSPNLGSDSVAYQEDFWSSLRIGQQNFKTLGSCRRCHMVCIDQETAEKSEEPFLTLTKTRRFDGRVFFGIHMCHLPDSGASPKDAQHPTVKVGEAITVNV